MKLNEIQELNEAMFIDYDEKGVKKLARIGYDENDQIVSLEYYCDDNNCNCAGSWVNGNEDQAVTFKTR